MTVADRTFTFKKWLSRSSRGEVYSLGKKKGWPVADINNLLSCVGFKELPDVDPEAAELDESRIIALVDVAKDWHEAKELYLEFTRLPDAYFIQDAVNLGVELSDAREIATKFPAYTAGRAMQILWNVEDADCALPPHYGDLALNVFDAHPLPSIKPAYKAFRKAGLDTEPALIASLKMADGVEQDIFIALLGSNSSQEAKKKTYEMAERIHSFMWTAEESKSTSVEDVIALVAPLDLR